jgi:hypothetical protein
MFLPKYQFRLYEKYKNLLRSGCSAPPLPGRQYLRMAYTNADADSDADAHTNADADTHTNSNAEAHTVWWRFADTESNALWWRFTDADSDAKIDAETHTDAFDRGCGTGDNRFCRRGDKFNRATRG